MRRRHLLMVSTAAVLLASGGAQALASGDTKDRPAAEPHVGHAVSQSASNSQVLPITLGAALAVPVNANVPISILGGPAQTGEVTQEGNAEAEAASANSVIEQTVGHGG